MRSVSERSQSAVTDHVDATDHRYLTYRLLGFGVFCLLPSAFLWPALRHLFIFILNNQTYTHIPLIPTVSLYLTYMWRDSIFERIGHAWKTGSALALSGAACLTFGRLNPLHLTATNQNSLLICGFVLFWLGAFLLFFGPYSFRAALFPLLFLFFMIPIPDAALSRVVFFLQEGSSKCAAWMFQAMGVPFFKSGFDFALPGVTIRVAEECSGIRSTLALIILSVLTGQLFLRSPWSRIVLCLFVVPISIAKNGFRIAVLSTMAVYVNSSFLTGPLHYHGGTLFFILALIPLFLLLRFLQNCEGKPPAALTPTRPGWWPTVTKT